MPVPTIVPSIAIRLPIAAILLSGLIVSASSLASRSDAPRSDKSLLSGKSLPQVRVLRFLPEKIGAVKLLLFGHSGVVETRISPDTILEGICVHCELPLHIKADQSGKGCAECSCGTSNAECLGGKPVKREEWRELFLSLPAGTSLKADFFSPEAPEKGIKRLIVDRRTILAPLKRLGGVAADQILARVKGIGVLKVDLADNDRQLRLLLKEDWTAERETRLEHELTGLGVEIDRSLLNAETAH